MDLDQIWSKDGLGQGQELIKIWGANHFFQNFHELKCWKIVPAKRLSSRLKAEGSLTVFDFPNLQRKLTKWKAIAFSGKLLLSVESYCFQRKENEEGQGAWKCNNWLLWIIIFATLLDAYDAYDCSTGFSDKANHTLPTIAICPTDCYFLVRCYEQPTGCSCFYWFFVDVPEFLVHPEPVRPIHTR